MINELTTGDVRAIVRNPYCPASLRFAWDHMVTTATNHADATRRRDFTDAAHWSRINARALASFDVIATKYADMIPALIAGGDPYAVDDREAA